MEALVYESANQEHLLETANLKQNVAYNYSKKMWLITTIAKYRLHQK